MAPAPRRTCAPFAAALLLGLAACGGGDGTGGGNPAADTTRAGAGTAQLILGGLDFAVGSNRIAFAVVRSDNSLVQRPLATLIAEGPDGSSTRANATLVPIAAHAHSAGAAPHDHAEIDDLYVANVRFATAGRYTLRVEPRGERVIATGSVEVREQTISPPVGTKAIPSDNPTLADAPAREISTATPPHGALLRHSVAESLDAGVPFVVAFATPAHCTSRVCGPTVDVVDAVRRSTSPGDVRFIHVEIYERNDPTRGPNRWFREWRLPSEPWVFVVDGEGVIRAKFEGFVSEDELGAAVREHLVAG